MPLKSFLHVIQSRSTYFKYSSEPGLSSARRIECLGCVKRKLTLKKRRECKILCFQRIVDYLWRDLILVCGSKFGHFPKIYLKS
eukprot:UN10532